MDDYNTEHIIAYVKPIYTLITLSSIVAAILNILRKLLYYRFNALKQGYTTIMLDWNFFSLNTTLF